MCGVMEIYIIGTYLQKGQETRKSSSDQSDKDLIISNTK